MKLFKIIVLLLFSQALKAQVLLANPESAFELQHNFNPEIISKKGIKKINYEIIDKKDFEVAVDKSLTETYEFNPDGLLARYYYTNIVKTIQKEIHTRNKRGVWETSYINDYVYDTVSTSYFYTNNNLILKRFHDGSNYYESRYYHYDSLHNLTKELRYKETNNSPDHSIFILGNQVLISADSFQYLKYSSGQAKCIYLNNENRSYKERITNYDSLGRTKTISESYTAASWIRQDQWFFYKNNRLSEARFQGNAHHDVILRNEYEYDEYNELYSEKKYKNEVLLKEISYVRDRSTNLLNSFIIRDPSNKTMRIVKLKYDFGSISKSGN